MAINNNPLGLIKNLPILSASLAVLITRDTIPALTKPSWPLKLLAATLSFAITWLFIYGSPKFEVKPSNLWKASSLKLNLLYCSNSWLLPEDRLFLAESIPSSVKVPLAPAPTTKKPLGVVNDCGSPVILE